MIHRMGLRKQVTEAKVGPLELSGERKREKEREREREKENVPSTVKEGKRTKGSGSLGGWGERALENKGVRKSSVLLHRE